MSKSSIAEAVRIFAHEHEHEATNIRVSVTHRV